VTVMLTGLLVIAPFGGDVIDYRSAAGSTPGSGAGGE